MSRACLLPTPGDPYICLLWLRMFQNFKKNIDKLYVSINSSIDHQVADFLVKEFEKEGAKVFYTDHLTQHGTEMARLTREADETHLMYVEDDGYVIDPNIIDKCFSTIEKGECDVVGSPRTSSSMDIQKVGSKVFNVDLSKAGDVGISLWPNFLFAKRSDMTKTDMDFNAHAWMKGDYIKEMNWVVQPDDPNSDRIVGDTFVWGSIQLRALGLRVKEVPQYHVHPNWDQEQRMKVGAFENDVPWIHTGSLSGSIYGILTDDEGVPLAYKESNYQKLPEGWKLPKFANTPMEKLEHQKRVAFQIMAWRLFDRPEIASFGQQYIKAVNRVIEQGELDIEDIANQVVAFQEVMKL